MKSRFLVVLTAALAVSACNPFSEARERDRDRDRSENSTRDRDAGRDRDRDRDREDRSARDESSRDGPAREASSDITEDWLIGTWSDFRDCSQPFTLTSDGVLRVGAGTGRWRLEGNVVIFENDSGRSQRLPIEKVNEDELRLTTTGRSSYRCS